VRLSETQFQYSAIYTKAKNVRARRLLLSSACTRPGLTVTIPPLPPACGGIEGGVGGLPFLLWLRPGLAVTIPPLPPACGGIEGGVGGLPFLLWLRPGLVVTVSTGQRQPFDLQVFCYILPANSRSPAAGIYRPPDTEGSSVWPINQMYP